MPPSNTPRANVENITLVDEVQPLRFDWTDATSVADPGIFSPRYPETQRRSLRRNVKQLTRISSDQAKDLQIMFSPRNVLRSLTAVHEKENAFSPRRGVESIFSPRQGPKQLDRNSVFSPGFRRGTNGNQDIFDFRDPGKTPVKVSTALSSTFSPRPKQLTVEDLNAVFSPHPCRETHTGSSKATQETVDEPLDKVQETYDDLKRIKYTYALPNTPRIGAEALFSPRYNELLEDEIDAMPPLSLPPAVASTALVE